MRLGILNNGYGLGTSLLFGAIQLFSRQRVPDAARLTFYRSDFYGSHSKALTHAAMRGASAWSVAERELMAAYVSNVNDCPLCVGAHTATATQACGSEARVGGLRATLQMLGKLTREGHTSWETYLLGGPTSCEAFLLAGHSSRRASKKCLRMICIASE